MSSAFHVLLPHADIGGRLVAGFEEAGLPTPNLIWESIAGGPASPLWRLLALTYRCMLPHMARLGLTLADIDDPDILPGCGGDCRARADRFHTPGLRLGTYRTALRSGCEPHDRGRR